MAPEDEAIAESDEKQSTAPEGSNSGKRAFGCQARREEEFRGAVYMRRTQARNSTSNKAWRPKTKLYQPM